MSSDLRYTPSHSEVAILAVGYVLIQVAANLTVAKSVTIGPNLALPIGSILFVISFTWIDLINTRLGRTTALKLVQISILANILLVAWLQLYVFLPGTEQWTASQTRQDAIAFVFGWLPRIYLASWLSNFICESVDVYVFDYLRRKALMLPAWLRSATSNMISAPLDGILFPIFAFAGVMSGADLLAIGLGGALYKLVIGIVSSPLIYAVKQRSLVHGEARQ